MMIVHVFGPSWVSTKVGEEGDEDDEDDEDEGGGEEGGEEGSSVSEDFDPTLGREKNEMRWIPK